MGAVCLIACGDESKPAPAPPAPPAQIGRRVPTARPALRDELLADLSAPRHASDGGGRAWIESFEGRPIDVVAGQSGAWRVVYEAGPLGIAPGGSLFLQVSPFWGWSTPQVLDPAREGYTRVHTEASGIELLPRTLDQQLLDVRIGTRALVAGERITLDYGAGERGAKADAYAERDSRFWIAVDGDGDGVRKLIADSPVIEVLPGAAALLSVIAPTVLRPGERGSLHVALLDAGANAGVRQDARVHFVDAPASLSLGEPIELSAEEDAIARLDFTPSEAGIFRWRAVATAADGREWSCAVGPLLVSANAPRVLWADLHGHSNESDGTGTPEQYWRYARDVAGLDAAALTDHDHWGMRFLDQRPEDREAFTALARSFDDPGRFVALPGYEYTDWIHGHRCVVSFGETAEMWSSLDPRSDTPQELWELLRGKDALSIPHHVAGGTIALDWDIAPDRELEPVVEIVSVQGSSEAADTEKRIYSAVPGHFARDALARGYVFGFIGSGDSHDGHPGLAHLGGHYSTSGLAAIVCEERTPRALLEAIRTRRVYATTGARILLRFSLAGRTMGSVIPASEVARSAALFASVEGSAPILRVDVIQGPDTAFSVDGEGSAQLVVSAELGGLAAGDWVYLRAVQTDGHMAWSSPIFVR